MKSIRPGITEKFLQQNGVRQVDANEAKALCGCQTAGLLIPYHDLDGQPIKDPDPISYFRLRKNGIEIGNKYHQLAGTKVHLFVPRGLAPKPHFSIIEGEFKAMSLADPEQGFNIPAVGISGFYCFQQRVHTDKEPELLPELKKVIQAFKPSRINFFGDSDTATNWQFSDAAIRLADLVPGCELYLPRLPYSGPKGIDDLRDKEPRRFETLVLDLLDEAIAIAPNMSADELAMLLLEREESAMKDLFSVSKQRAVEKLIKMAAGRSPLREEIIQFAKIVLHQGKTEFRKRVEAKARELTSEDLQETLEKIRPLVRTMFFDGKLYYRKDSSGSFGTLSNRQDAKLTLRNEFGLNGPSLGKLDSEDELGLFIIHKENGVRAIPALAGWSAGIHEMNRTKYLIQTGIKLIAHSSSGDASPVVNLLSDFFGRGIDDLWRVQFTTFLGWLKQICGALHHPESTHSPGQAVFLVGDTNIGKNFVQEQIITPLLGGRACDPSDVLFGKTPFNAACMGAEHLCMSDANFPFDERLCANFRNQIKRLVANPSQMLSARFVEQVNVVPIQRLTVSLNPTLRDRVAIPAIDTALQDKIIIFHCYRPEHMPGSSVSERNEFVGKIRTALPAFLGQLFQWQVPFEFVDSRFGIRAFQHPTILQLIYHKDPINSLGLMLDEIMLKLGKTEVTLASAEWHALLVNDCGRRYMELVLNSQQLGRMIAELRTKQPAWRSRITRPEGKKYDQNRNEIPQWKIVAS